MQPYRFMSVGSVVSRVRGTSVVAAELGLMRFDLPFCEPFFTNALSSSIGIGNTIVVLFSAPTSDSVCRKRIFLASKRLRRLRLKRPDSLSGCGDLSGETLNERIY